MVTYPIDFPSDLDLSEMEVKLMTASTQSISPFTYEEQVYDFGGEVWQISGSLPPMNREQAEIYNSFLLKLRGRVGTFTMPIAGGRDPLGTQGGSPVVDGASQTGDTLNVRGATANVTNWVKAGDWFSLGTGSNTRLYKVVDNADTDVSGNTTLTIVPKLRASPSDGDALDFTDAKGLFRLTDPESTYSASASNLYNISFTARESL